MTIAVPVYQRYSEREIGEDQGARRDKNAIAAGSDLPVIAFEELLLTGYTVRETRRLVERWRAAENAA